MKLIPSIDLLDGQVVRLRQGDYKQVTAYAADPVEQARCFQAAGAERLHIVDLEGARSGAPGHLNLIRQILDEVGIAVQVGGGIRSAESAQLWWEAGAERVVIGTLAVREPDVVEALCVEHPGAVVVALDARGDEVAIEGWLEASGKALSEMALNADRWGAAAILYTDIARDGMGKGPSIERTAALQKSVGIEVIASGGVGCLEDLAALAAAGIRSAISGRALYEGAFTVEEALHVCRTGDALGPKAQTPC